MEFLGFLLTLIIGFFAGMILAVKFSDRFTPFVNSIFNLFKPKNKDDNDKKEN